MAKYIEMSAECNIGTKNALGKAPAAKPQEKKAEETNKNEEKSK